MSVFENAGTCLPPSLIFMAFRMSHRRLDALHARVREPVAPEARSSLHNTRPRMSPNASTTSCDASTTSCDSPGRPNGPGAFRAVTLFVDYVRHCGTPTLAGMLADLACGARKKDRPESSKPIEVHQA